MAALKPADVAQALRLPFLSASVLPFVFGSLLADELKLVPLLLGLAATASTHLSGNVINDYADSKTGADAQDTRHYAFFGGSKLIQHGVFTAAWYKRVGIALAAAAVGAVLALAAWMRTATVAWLYLFVLLLTWMYSEKPLRLSYRRLGELVVFLLFGPACVMGGHYLQTAVFPTWQGLFLSLPFGFLTAGILLANEVPDAPDDRAAGKFNLVGVVGRTNGYLLYAASVAGAFAAIAAAIATGYLGRTALLSAVGLLPATAAVRILRRHYGDKLMMTRSSRLAILTHLLVGVILILDVLL